jgi:hypothetical protein
MLLGQAQKWVKVKQDRIVISLSIVHNRSFTHFQLDLKKYVFT